MCATQSPRATLTASLPNYYATYETVDVKPVPVRYNLIDAAFVYRLLRI